jgi:hypothetical protein
MQRGATMKRHNLQRLTKNTTTMVFLEGYTYGSDDEGFPTGVNPLEQLHTGTLARGTSYERAGRVITQNFGYMMADLDNPGRRFRFEAEWDEIIHIDRLVSHANFTRHAIAVGRVTFLDVYAFLIEKIEENAGYDHVDPRSPYSINAIAYGDDGGPPYLFHGYFQIYDGTRTCPYLEIWADLQGQDPEQINVGVVGRVEDAAGLAIATCCEVLAMLAGANPVNVRLEDRRHCAGTPAYGRPRRKLCLPLGAITDLLEGARTSLVRLDIDGDLEPILFESLRAYTEQEQTTAHITATLEGEAMALTRGVWSATNVQPVGVDDNE